MKIMDKKTPSKTNLLKFENQHFNADLSELRAANLDLKSKLPLMKEYIFMVAELTRAKYNALLNEGFTEKQAIELSKALF